MILDFLCIPTLNIHNQWISGVKIQRNLILTCNIYNNVVILSLSLTQLHLHKWTGMTLLSWKLWTSKMVKQVRLLEMSTTEFCLETQTVEFLQTWVTWVTWGCMTLRVIIIRILLHLSAYCTCTFKCICIEPFSL